MIYDTTMFTRFVHEIGFEPWTPKISGAVFGAIPSVLLTHYISSLMISLHETRALPFLLTYT